MNYSNPTAGLISTIFSPYPSVWKLDYTVISGYEEGRALEQNCCIGSLLWPREVILMAGALL